MKLVLLGAGNMGVSILAGVLSSGEGDVQATVIEQDAARAAAVADRDDIVVGDASAAADADLLLVAVKPHQVQAAVAPLSDTLPSGAVVLSVAAGLTVRQLQGWFPVGQPVVRAMPNTAALVGAGVTAITPGRYAEPHHVEAATGLLSAVGVVVQVTEDQMDAVTAVSGSGPAYFCLVIEALVEAGVRIGLARDLATTLAVQTMAGTAQMLVKTGEHPAVLRERVTSPGGTTAAALHVLESAALRAAFVDAAIANRERARQMSSEGGH